jgi:hypothetical protein
METMNRKDQITRRGFLELSSAAIATAGLLPDASAAKVAPRSGDTPKPDSPLLTGKIALEEHFQLPDTAEPDRSLGYALFTPELQRQMKDRTDR